MTWGCLGVLTLGFIPLLMWATTFRRWPRFLDREGLTLRSGQRLRWFDLTRAVRVPGLLHLYFGSLDVPVALGQIEEPERVADLIRRATGKEFEEAPRVAPKRRREETPPLRATLNGIGFALILAGIAVVLWPIYVNSRMTARIQGQLDPRYTEITTTKKQGGRVLLQYLSYEVSYRFSVQGATFIGRDIIGAAPTTRQVFVYYDPAKPARNRLVLRGSWDPDVSPYSLFGFVLGTLVLIRRRLFWR